MLTRTHVEFDMLLYEELPWQIMPARGDQVPTGPPSMERLTRRMPNGGCASWSGPIRGPPPAWPTICRRSACTGSSSPACAGGSALQTCWSDSIEEVRRRTASGVHMKIARTHPDLAETTVA